MRKAVPLLAFALALTSPMAASAQWQDDYPVIRIGIAVGPNITLERARVEPFRAYLAERLGVSVELALAPDYGSIIADQLTGRLHATLLSATAFAAANTSCDNCLEPLVVPTTSDGEDGFYAVLVVPAESEIGGPDDLADARLAVAGRDSVAGRLLPLALFVGDGVAVPSANLVESANPTASVLRLLDDSADAALAWTGLGNSFAGRGALAQLAAAGALTADDVAVVWTSPLVPHGPLAVLGNLATDLKTELADAMMQMAQTAPQALAVVNAFGGGFAPVDVSAYDPLVLLTDPDLTLP